LIGALLNGFDKKVWLKMLRLCPLQRTFRRFNMNRQKACAALELDAGATSKDIKNAFLNKAKIYHPDNQLTGNAERFKEVKEAADYLEKIKYQPSVKKSDRGRQTYQSYHQQQSYHQEPRANQRPKSDDWREEFFHGAGAALVLVPIFILFLIMRSIFFVYMKASTSMKEPEVGPGEAKPHDSFLVQLATVLEFIRFREKYKFSNRELFLDYVRHVTTKSNLVWLKDADVVYIGSLCSKNSYEATRVLENPKLLDQVQGRFKPDVPPRLEGVQIKSKNGAS